MKKYAQATFATSLVMLVRDLLQARKSSELIPLIQRPSISI